jgi:DNA gyrase/topoisomerase IV subunit B
MITWHHICVYVNRWEVCVSGTQDGSFEQISYVNSICTSKGGTHVKAVTGNSVCRHYHYAMALICDDPSMCSS